MNMKRGIVIGSALIALVGLMSSPGLTFASDQMAAKEILQQNCVQCHRLEGKLILVLTSRRPISSGPEANIVVPGSSDG